MAVKLGNTSITKMYLGSTLISTAYLGTISLLTPPAPPDTEAPTVGTLSTVVRTNTSTATLTWTAASDNIGVTNYKVYRSALGVDSGFTLLKTVGNILTTTDTTIANFDDFYYYYIVALDGSANESTASNHVAVAVQSATDIFPSGTPVSDNTTEGTEIFTTFTSGRYTIVSADSTDKQVGTYSVKFASSGTGSQQYRDSFHPVIAGKTYIFRWWSKSSVTGMSRIKFATSVPTTTIYINETSWTEHQQILTATATGNVRIYWYSAYAPVTGNETMWVDDFRMYELD